MRIAFIGKGGSGKSTLVGTFARLLGRADGQVLVLDSDPMPGLAFSLGVDPQDNSIPDDAVEQVEIDGRKRWQLREGLTSEEAIRKYAIAVPDDVRLLQLGKLGKGGDIGRSSAAYRQIAADLPGAAFHVIADLPGGTRQPFYGWGDAADTMLVVVEPTAQGALTARRLARLRDRTDRAIHLVAIANKVRHESDADLVAERTGLEVVAAIPSDPEVHAADRAGLAPVDVAPDSPFVHAVAAFVERARSGQLDAPNVGADLGADVGAARPAIAIRGGPS